MTYIYSFIRAVLFLHSRSSVFGLTLGIKVLPKTRKKIPKRLGDTYCGRVLARGVPPLPTGLALRPGPLQLAGNKGGFLCCQELGAERREDVEPTGLGTETSLGSLCPVLSQCLSSCPTPGRDAPLSCSGQTAPGK